jgi:excisionase family DNA binding protein
MRRPTRKRHYTVAEAAKQLGVTRIAVYRAIKQHRLDADWGVIGPPPKGWRIARGDLRAYEVSLLHQQVGKKTA